MLLCLIFCTNLSCLIEIVRTKQKLAKIITPKGVTMVGPCRVGLVDSVSACHTVGSGFTSWPGHTQGPS